MAFSAAIASVFGGLMAKQSLQAPVIYSLPVFILAFILSLSLTEPKYHRDENNNTLIFNTKKSLATILLNRQLLLLIILAVLSKSISESIHKTSQIFYELNQIPVIYFGFIFSFVWGLAAAGSAMSHKISNFLGDKKLLLYTFSLQILLLLAATFLRGWLSVIVLTLTAFPYGLREPAMKHLTNEQINSKNRTTVLSVRNFAASLGFALIIALFGFIIDNYGIINTYRLAGILLATSILIISYLKNSNERLQSKSAKGN